MENKSLLKRIIEYKKNSTINLKDFIVVEIENKNIENIINKINENDFIKLYKEIINDLSKRFQFQYIYFNKFKIICILNEKNITYNGNINKLISNITSYISVSFNQNINKFYLDYKKDIEGSHFKFISQEKLNYLYELENLQFSYNTEIEVFSIDSINEVFNIISFYLNENIYYSKLNFVKEKLNIESNIPIKDIDSYINKIIDETGYDWDNLHEFEKYGISFKYKTGFKFIKNKLEFNDNYIDYILS